MLANFRPKVLISGTFSSKFMDGCVTFWSKVGEISDQKYGFRAKSWPKLTLFGPNSWMGGHEIHPKLGKFPTKSANFGRILVEK